MKNKTRSALSGATTRLLILYGMVWLMAAACSPAPKEEAQGHPVVVEIVGEVPDTVLSGLCRKYGIDTRSVYGWKNRRLIYDFPAGAAGFKDELSALFSGAEIREYRDPYYIFDRSNCDSGQTEGAWAHKILTTNLVSDPAMQQEYMDYHARQFEQFPEVSAGFCRAEFQRLIMYRNGRQLMLIISYPAGKDYDALNARTVANNPRVDEWNSLMGRYQEGIEGTAPEETWVFFEPVF